MMTTRSWNAPPLALAIALGACGGASETSRAPNAVYRVRGQVVALHGEGEHARASIAHEAIPDFEDRQGNEATMPAMTMAFGIGPGVDARSLTPGSKWELTFEVAWNREPAILITTAKPLPEDTQLTLPSDHP